MAFYGPKAVNAKGDTTYFAVPENAIDFDEVHLDKQTDGSGNVIFTAPWSKADLNNNKAFIALLLKPGSREKLGGLLEYEKYKKEKIREVPIMIINPSLFSLPDLDTSKSVYTINYSKKYLKDSLGIEMDNFHLVFLKDPGFWTDKNEFKYTDYNNCYFNQKPEHVFDYFAVLVDKDRHIRGYYDPTFISEVKRMLEEYKHLVLKDEHAEMQNTNKIEKK